MRKLLLGFLFAALALVGVASPATAQRVAVAPADVGAAIAVQQHGPTLAAYRPPPCGYYARHYSYYNHCARDTWIQIRVEFWWGLDSTTTCVGPGITRINDNVSWRGGITDAYYTGRLCRWR